MLAMPWSCVSWILFAFALALFRLFCAGLRETCVFASVRGRRSLLPQLLSLFPYLIQRCGRSARILWNPYFYHRWQSRFHRTLERRHELRRRFHEFSMRPERARVGREVGVRQRRAMHAIRIVALLMHTDRAVLLVVHHHEYHCEVVLHCRCQLLARHHETSIAGQ